MPSPRSYSGNRIGRHISTSPVSRYPAHRKGDQGHGTTQSVNVRGLMVRCSTDPRLEAEC